MDDLRSLLLSSGSKIDSVHFIKRSDGTIRQICYRLHVSNSRYGKKPWDTKNTGKFGFGKKRSKPKNFRKFINRLHNQMTVYDVKKSIEKS